ncbi:Cobalt-precorrin-3B C(17)-methyltransferase [uncultured delta proteobacterium]|uniref:Cobalt-precorrin-3B C(17)-methyltransferase n=1 Tax=uncultured delta proteobacterium TaxID=34034 RepID=A0A212JDU6_9DELT|nr:Cobalt-precorrin-3B C(17)-methyltransferase [uncultured delta proteobacterium]
MPDAPTRSAAPSGGELFVIGLGPGNAGLLAPDALAALSAADCIAGYSGYVDLVDPAILKGKEIIATGMRGEVERCEEAIGAARSGKKACLVCSGDPGVYAMAGLVLEMLHARGLSLAEVPLTIVPGIPAVCAAAALLGAPLTHDFACVSLSDLLTEPEVIERRLAHAFAADFVVALYNPRSKKRRDNLARAIGIAKRHREGVTPVGHVRNAFRPDQEVTLSTLAAFDPESADMFSIILVGNGATAFLPAPGGVETDWGKGARMYTPRGYGAKYHLE